MSGLWPSRIDKVDYRPNQCNLKSILSKSYANISVPIVQHIHIVLKKTFLSIAKPEEAYKHI